MIRNTFISLALVSLLACGHCLANDRVIAKYNGQAVKKSEITEKIKTVFGALPEGKTDFDELNKNVKQKLINEFINEKVLIDAMSKSSIHKDETYNKQVDAVLQQIKVRLFLESQAKKNLTPEMIKVEYNNHVKTLQTSDDIKVAHILISSEEDAIKAHKEIVSKKISFEDAAKKYSLDSTKTKGGELGYLNKGQTVPEFERAAYSLQKGEMSEPVKTNFGYHIIKLLDTRKRDIPNFEDIKQSLEQNVAMRLMQEYAGELFNKAKVETFTDSK